MTKPSKRPEIRKLLRWLHKEQRWADNGGSSVKAWNEGYASAMIQAIYKLNGKPSKRPR